MDRVSNGKLKRSPETHSQTTGNDFYCSLCSVDCINSTGKLLHVLEPKHIEAYQSSLKVSSCGPTKCSKLGSKGFQDDDRWKLFTLNVNSDAVCEHSSGFKTRMASASGDKLQPHLVQQSKSENLSSNVSAIVNCVSGRISTGEENSRGSVSTKPPNSSQKRKKSKCAKKKLQRQTLKDSISDKKVPPDNAKNVRSDLEKNSETCNEDSGKNPRNLGNTLVISSEHSEICCPNAIDVPQECSHNSYLSDEPLLVLNGSGEETPQHVMAQLDNDSRVGDKTCDVKSMDSSLQSCSLDDQKLEGNNYLVDSKSETIPQSMNVALQTPVCNTTRRIIVEGFPAEVDRKTVINQFTGYGFIKSFLFVGSVIHIEYYDCHAVEKIMGEQARKKINIQRREIQVKKNMIKPIKEFQMERIPECVQRLFSSEDYFMTNVNTFLSRLCLGPCAMHKQLTALRSIISCLEEFGPTALPFGSRVSGLANEYSDFDIFIDITKPCNLVETKCERSTQTTIIRQAAKKLRECGHFKAVTEIANASVPIIRCMHLSYGLKCDLSFLEPSGVYNTRLILFYLSLDTRVRPLILLIRYWACTHCLSGREKFSNYCLSILCIFYLQQIPDEPILPSVSYLMDLSSERSKLTVDCWDYDFCENFSVIEKTVNKSSVFQLMKGFFKFYFEFDAQNLVISPFVGKVIKKNCFEPDMEQLLPKEFRQYIMNVSQKVAMPFNVNHVFCVQDPFVHNRNLGKQIGVALFQHFQICCGLYANNSDFVYKYCVPFKGFKSFQQRRTY